MSIDDDDQALLNAIIARSNRMMGHSSPSAGPTVFRPRGATGLVRVTMQSKGEAQASDVRAQDGRLAKVDELRKHVSGQTSKEKKVALGQYMTPAPVARFMASMFPLSSDQDVHVLDAGAGIGSLTSAFLDQCLADPRTRVRVTAYEVDTDVLPILQKNLSGYGSRVHHTILATDFIQHAVFSHCTGTVFPCTHAILNPPYMKIATDSTWRHLLRKAGLETVNLYTAFVGISLLLLKQGGWLCAITPRSFCNGPYYRPFREFMLRRASLVRIHLLESRKQAFADDGVLQENVIMLWQRGGVQGRVEISTSSDSSFADLATTQVPFDQVVRSSHDDNVIHIPTRDRGAHVLPVAFNQKLESLRVGLSTGPVVDFRLRDHLRSEPEEGAIPLLYPSHFSDGRIEWPKQGKKPNAIMRNGITEKWLYPRGNYALVRRFSSKEERRRIVATFLAEDDLPYEVIGLENHVNVFHSERRGLDRSVARGLCVYLNSTLFDEHFRIFNGHTQVNVADLRSMTYPPLDALIAMGNWADKHPRPTQEEIDGEVNRYA